ncbi:mitochondrial intermediate peptidase-like protein [Mollisia scopiformis]|uniref:Mitochondrial intermediate peptidase n=1 Tax=Mollisia scopiformis TaxID=149040 RepID=A0A194XED9_MOLSC|nr:mitochondrial intermediate peptidase-like protein [Mollisia scopiformis]KUJ18555.1 mitochondrial intermediate peptidase-like protein [Mollisia scopiformis]
MFKKSISRPWVCSRCLQRQLPRQIRGNHAQAAPKVPDNLGFTASFRQRHVDTAPPGVQHDDRKLRQIFDSPGFWKEYSQSSKSGRNAGLFQNRYLTESKGFEEFANTTLERAKRIVERVLEASSPEQYRYVVRDLDRLSDLLCRVIDLSDFVRATHPDPRIQQAATQAYGIMFEYMNVLNTTTGLAKQLDIAIEQCSESGVWDEEEKMVAHILKKDFAKSAIDLPRGDRERFVSLSQEISEVGTEFVDYMSPEKEYLSFPSSRMKGMDPMLVRQLTQWGKVALPTIGGPASAALRSVEDASVREDIFMASRTASKATLSRLQSLLQKRAQLARLSRFDSYAHMNLEDKMAKSPESVNGFLRELSKDNSSFVKSELEHLLKAKAMHMHTSDPSLQPWDKEYYMSRILASAQSRTRNADFLSSYFSLGRVMQGLSRLFSRLYGIRFVPHETLPGETWNPDVRRLDVVSEIEGHVAVLYCDLFSRPGKSPNPAHFTLRCSRLIRNEEIEEAATTPNSLFTSAEEAANDGMAISPSTSSGVMQLPTIALICDFATTPGSLKPSLLSFSEVVTLFHEMGHAIHSILGRTNFQNVSGTRCATDFAELPSVLMEHFAADPSVLALFATHYETDQPLPYKMVAEKLVLDKKFEGADAENQIILSMLDQAYHSSLPLDTDFDTTQVYHELQRNHGILPSDPPGTSWQGFFGHLFGYGGTYYSYLFDRVLAKQVWQEVFRSGNQGGSVTRENGELFKGEVLQFGGSRDPWTCLSRVLKDERLEHGGEKAMGLVGSWGIEGRREASSGKL